MYFIRTPNIIKKLFSPELHWDFANDDGKIYLTFDDGPNPEVTPEVLQILDQFNIKATFFCVGDNVRKHPDTFEQLREAGHVVANHTFDHLNGWKASTRDYLKSVDECARFVDSGLFRPPYGRIKPAQVKALKDDYKIIMWTVLAGDFDKRYSKEECAENVIRHTQTGSIIVFHDSRKTKEKVLYALPKSIEVLLNKGYSFDLINGGNSIPEKNLK